MLNVDDARVALENMDDFAKMDVSVNPIGPYNVLKDFIYEVERLLHYNAIKQTPALFKVPK